MIAKAVPLSHLILRVKSRISAFGEGGGSASCEWHIIGLDLALN